MPPPPETGRAVLRPMSAEAKSPWSCPLPVAVLGSVDGRPGLAAAGIRAVGVAARLVEFQDALRRRNVEPAELAFEVAEIPGRDAVILGDDEQQRHRGLPRE